MPYYRLFYQVIWATKGRQPSITQSNRGLIYGAISSKVDALSGIIHALNGMEDHVHLVVTIPPNIAIGTFIGQVKGGASYEAEFGIGELDNFKVDTLLCSIFLSLLAGVACIYEGHLDIITSDVLNLFG